jgi:hypothetical protein
MKGEKRRGGTTITKLPPGVARGAHDLRFWGQNRMAGQSGVKGDKPEPKKDAADRWLDQRDARKPVKQSKRQRREAKRQTPPWE